MHDQGVHAYGHMWGGGMSVTTESQAKPLPTKEEPNKENFSAEDEPEVFVEVLRYDETDLDLDDESEAALASFLAGEEDFGDASMQPDSKASIGISSAEEDDEPELTVDVLDENAQDLDLSLDEDALVESTPSLELEGFAASVPFGLQNDGTTLKLRNSEASPPPESEPRIYPSSVPPPAPSAPPSHSTMPPPPNNVDMSKVRDTIPVEASGTNSVPPPAPVPSTTLEMDSSLLESLVPEALSPGERFHVAEVQSLTEQEQNELELREEQREPPAAPTPEAPIEEGSLDQAEVIEAEPSSPPPEASQNDAPWYKTFFEEDYMRTVWPASDGQVSRQCTFVENMLRLTPGARLVDLGCGLGLQATELARRGYEVTAVDLSAAMLSSAHWQAKDEGLDLSFLHEDMRDLKVENAFDAALCLGTTFGYFDEAENRRSVQAMQRVVRPGGKLLIDVQNRDYVLQRLPHLRWYQGNGCLCMEEGEFDYATSRLEVKRMLSEEGRGQREANYSIRLYSVHELRTLLEQNGFRILSVSGQEATPHVFFGPESPRILIVAERKHE